MMIKITPSPDWYAGFSDFKTISPSTETYYNRIVIRSYVWSAGTDGGLTYTALDDNLDPQTVVKRFVPPGKVKKAGERPVPPKGQFLDPTKTFIPIPAEIECILRVGEGSLVAGVPVNDSDFYPPLYVPRADDFIDGMPPNGAAQRANSKVPNYKAPSGATELFQVQQVYEMALAALVGCLVVLV